MAKRCWRVPHRAGSSLETKCHSEALVPCWTRSNVAKCPLSLSVHPPPSASPSPRLCTSPSSTPLPLQDGFLSTCWSGEANLWAYLAPPESSKHSFLWLSVWWRQAAVWNAARRQQHSQQCRESRLQGCKKPLFPLLSPFWEQCYCLWAWHILIQWLCLCFFADMCINGAVWSETWYCHHIIAF